MKIISGRGIEVDLGNDYFPARVSLTNPSLCWDNDYQTSLRAVAQEVCSERGDTYPFVQVTPSGLNPVTKATFLAVDPESNKELLCKTKSILYSRIPKREVELLQRIIDHIHEQANNEAIPSERREFFRNFSLPDPVKMPECWRVSGWWNRKLYILWGLEKRTQYGRGTFMPSSAVLDEHENGKRRRLSDVLGFWGVVPTLKYTASRIFAPKSRTSQRVERSSDAVVSPLSGASKDCVGGDSTHVVSTSSLEGSSGGGVTSGRTVNTEIITTRNPGITVDNGSGCLKWVLGILSLLLFIILLCWIMRGCYDGRHDTNVEYGDGDAGGNSPGAAGVPVTESPKTESDLPVGGGNEGDAGKKTESAPDDHVDGEKGEMPTGQGGQDNPGEKPSDSAGAQENVGTECKPDAPVGGGNEGDPGKKCESAPGDPVGGEKEKEDLPPAQDGKDSSQDGKRPDPAGAQENGESEYKPDSPVGGGNEGDSGKKCESTPGDPVGGEKEKEDSPSVSVEEPKKGSNESKSDSLTKPSICSVCGETLDKDGVCPNRCKKCKARHLDVNNKCPVCDKPITSGMFVFEVSKPQIISEKDDIANVRFTVNPVSNLSGKDYVIDRWFVNTVPADGVGMREFTPKGGLLYSKKYTIDVEISVEGKKQRVIPYQWNLVDPPSWQIVKDRQQGEYYRFKLICANSSSVTYEATDWGVKYRKRDKYLHFTPAIKKDGENAVLVSSKIEGYESYYLELTAKISAKIRKRQITGERTDLFEFMHGDSSQTLLRMKYENALDKIFFCVARNEDGSMHNGTAFAVSEKYLLTNYHVAVGNIEEQYGGAPSRVKGLLRLSNETKSTFFAKVVASDRLRDIALLRICSSTGEETEDKFERYFSLAGSRLVRSIKAGDERSSRSVLAIGYPRGTTRNGPPAFTDGKAEMTVSVSANSAGERYENIGHYTNIEPGYSGGPLIDMDTGLILGVNRGGMIPRDMSSKPLKVATSANEVRNVFSEMSANHD